MALIEYEPYVGGGLRDVYLGSVPKTCYYDTSTNKLILVNKVETPVEEYVSLNFDITFDVPIGTYLKNRTLILTINFGITDAYATNLDATYMELDNPCIKVFLTFDDNDIVRMGWSDDLTVTSPASSKLQVFTDSALTDNWRTISIANLDKIDYNFVKQNSGKYAWKTKTTISFYSKANGDQEALDFLNDNICEASIILYDNGAEKWMLLTFYTMGEGNVSTNYNVSFVNRIHSNITTSNQYNLSNMTNTNCYILDSYNRRYDLSNMLLGSPGGTIGEVQWNPINIYTKETRPNRIRLSFKTTITIISTQFETNYSGNVAVAIWYNGKQIYTAWSKNYTIDYGNTATVEVDVYTEEFSLVDSYSNIIYYDITFGS